MDRKLLLNKNNMKKIIVISILASAILISYANSRDKQTWTIADEYETCVYEKFGRTPYQLKETLGYFPECNK